MAEAAATESTGAKLGASGRLTRSFGFTGTLVIGLLCVSLTYSGLLPFSTIAGAWPGSSLAIALTIALFFALLHATTYAFIGSAAPFSGADYVLASRTISPVLAFASSWTFTIASALVAGGLIAFIPKVIIPIFIRSFGVALENTGLFASADLTTSPQTVVLIGTLIALVAFVASMVSQKTLTRIFQVGALLSLVGWLVLYGQLAFSSPDAFSLGWNQFLGAGSYSDRIQLATSLGFSVRGSTQPIALSGLMVGFWIFFGAFIPTYFAREVRDPGTNLIKGSWAALLISGIVFIGATLLLQRVIPAEWLSAESFLYAHNYQGLSVPWIIFYAVILQPSFPLLVIIALAWAYTLINLVQTYLLFTSRIILAWTNDGLLPRLVGYIHPQRSSPLLSMLIVAVFAEIGLVDAALDGALTSQMSFVFLAAVSMILPVAAAFLFPFLKKNWFASSPALVRAKIGPLPIMSLIAFFTLACLIGLLVAGFLFPGPGGLVNQASIWMLVLLFLSGVIWFNTRRNYWNTRGQNLLDRFKVMPEEDETFD